MRLRAIYAIHYAAVGELRDIYTRLRAICEGPFNGDFDEVVARCDAGDLRDILRSCGRSTRHSEPTAGELRDILSQLRAICEGPYNVDGAEAVQSAIDGNYPISAPRFMGCRRACDLRRGPG